MDDDGLRQASRVDDDRYREVSWWIDNRASSNSNVTKEVRTAVAQELPIDEEYEDKTSRYKQWNVKKEFVDADANASTHLARNALGGANRGLTSALLSMRAPRARTYM